MYYSLIETAILVNRDYKTVLRWLKVSEELWGKGRAGLIPTPTIINNANYFSDADVRQIIKNAKQFKRGLFKEFSDKKTTYEKLKEENERLKYKIRVIERTGI